jgi:hypothetical protein
MTRRNGTPENLIQNHTLTLADDDLQVSQRLEYDMDRLNLLQARTSCRRGSLTPL